VTDARADRLYELLPAVYRKRDAEVGQPLRALLRVIAEQADVVQKDIAWLYENWFIETCEEWAVPYIAELVGWRPVYAAGTFVPRREVAHTIRNRRRKGTLSILEMLARDVAGWPARGVEFYRLLAVTQSLNHLQLSRGRTVDLRNADALDRIDGPFDELAHVADVRRYNVSSVGLYVWRLGLYSITRAPAYHLERRARKRDRNRYTFSVLGNDVQLYTLPVDEPERTHIADETNVPAPIRRRAFDERTADYYGKGKSLAIWIDDLETPVALDRIVAADLTDWAYSPKGDDVAVDPLLGRIALADDRAATEVLVSYHYAFTADVGGGEYERQVTPVGDRKLYVVSQQQAATNADVFESVADALTAWKHEQDEHPDAIVEIADSGAYSEALEIELQAGRGLELRARVGTRPVLRLLDVRTSRGDAMVVEGPKNAHVTERDPKFILDGILLAGRGLQIRNRLSRVMIRHCTLVPGWTIGAGCNPEHETEPSLELLDTAARVVIERSIVGSILVDRNEVLTDPLRLAISDSIVDATRPDYEAIGVSGGGRVVAHAELTMARCTVIGEVNVHAIELAENSIFYGRVLVARRQTGCVRFCYVRPGSRTPRRYACQPDGAIAAADADAKHRAETRVRPRFESLRYGSPVYARLGPTTAREIARGAEDESAMGVFHHRFEPQREVNLATRLDEFTPAGFRGVVIPAN
jgi:hypothetical protein